MKFGYSATAGVLTTAFFLGDAEARLLTPPAVQTRGQQALVLLAGVLTLAVLRVVLGGFAVFISMLFGLGALGVWLSVVQAGAPAGCGMKEMGHDHDDDQRHAALRHGR
jgi:hypothetical protein